MLLDVVLPDMSGYELCRRIRCGHAVTDGWDPDLPIIMISAKVEYTDRVRGLTRGADDYVTKPFHYPELVARIAAVQSRATRGARPPRPPACAIWSSTRSRATSPRAG